MSFLGIPLRGFHSIWGIRGVPCFGKYPFEVRASCRLGSRDFGFRFMFAAWASAILFVFNGLLKGVRGFKGP